MTSAAASIAKYHTQVCVSDRLSQISLSLEVAKLMLRVSVFDRTLRGAAEEPPVKFQSDPLTLTINLAASRFDEIWEIQLSFL